jgi:hypothetical protein
MKIKKEKKERKAKVKPKVTKGCTLSAPLTPLALRAPLEENDLGLRELFGSISGDEVKDEEDLMNSPKADPVDQQNPEPIEVDAIEFKLHPS